MSTEALLAALSTAAAAGDAEAAWMLRLVGTTGLTSQEARAFAQSGSVMPSLETPTDGQRLRSASLLADGYGPEHLLKFVHAEWRVAQRIAVDECQAIQPLSQAELVLVRQWIGDLVTAEEVIERIEAKRSAHEERHSEYRAKVNAERAQRKSAKRSRAPKTDD